MSNTELNLDELEALAKAARPGPWELRATSWSYYITQTENPGWGSVCETAPSGKADMEFITAANPTTVLALIARVRELEGACDTLTGTLANVDKAVRATLGIDPNADDALPELVADWLQESEGRMVPVGWVRAHVSLGNEPPSYSFTQNPEAAAAWVEHGLTLPRAFAPAEAVEEHLRVQRATLLQQIASQKSGSQA